MLLVDFRQSLWDGMMDSNIVEISKQEHLPHKIFAELCWKLGNLHKDRLQLHISCVYAQETQVPSGRRSLRKNSFIYLYFWLCWVLAVALALVAASRGFQTPGMHAALQLLCLGFLCSGLLLVAGYGL